MRAHPVPPWLAVGPTESRPTEPTDRASTDRADRHLTPSPVPPGTRCRSTPVESWSGAVGDGGIARRVQSGAEAARAGAVHLGEAVDLPGGVEVELVHEVGARRLAGRSTARGAVAHRVGASPRCKDEDLALGPFCAARISRVYGIWPYLDTTSKRVSAFPPSFSHDRTGPTRPSVAAFRTFFGTSPPGALSAGSGGGGVRRGALAREREAGMTAERLMYARFLLHLDGSRFSLAWLAAHLQGTLFFSFMAAR